mmetsp:Transcript_18233/g.27191  ORF Transcript_18233/g.27191 Transcript_18233/m.27191 type:complete len:385 (+) Transcript_18233:36-1190(+)
MRSLHLLCLVSAGPTLGAAFSFPAGVNKIAPSPAVAASCRLSPSQHHNRHDFHAISSIPYQKQRCKETRLQAATLSAADNKLFPSRNERGFFELKTLIRVLLPAIVSGAIAYATLPALNNQIATFVLKVSDPGKISMLGDAVQSFISLVGLLYSILVGQVFGFLYSQQEALYLALFDEVTEAKSLLEQVALVSQGRTMYSTCLNSIARYVKQDLLEGMESFDGSITPSLLVSARPSDDPLEAILYLTSVGIPGHVYDTVRSLRQARSRRLGALQRKVPVIHLIMLWLLGIIMVGSFPVFLGVSEAAASMGGLITRSNMTVQSGLFGVATFSVVMCKSVLIELWRTKGGAYNVDKTLKVMVSGLKKELDERMDEAKKIMKRSKQE